MEKIFFLVLFVVSVFDGFYGSSEIRGFRGGEGKGSFISVWENE